MLRNFAMNPLDLRKGFEETIRRRDKMVALISLEKAKVMAAERVRQMNDLLAQFEAQTSGCFKIGLSFKDVRDFDPFFGSD